MYKNVHLFLTCFCILYVIGDVMEKLIIKNKLKNNDTITRTIRINGKTFDRINELAEKNNISFNSVINQIIEYGLSNLEE